MIISLIRKVERRGDHRAHSADPEEMRLQTEQGGVIVMQAEHFRTFIANQGLKIIN